MESFAKLALVLLLLGTLFLPASGCALLSGKKANKEKNKVETMGDFMMLPRPS